MDCSLPGSSVHGIPQQEYWSGLPFPTPGESSLPRSSALQADSLPSEPQYLPTLCVQCWIKQIRILVSFRVNKSDMGERTYRFNINEIMYKLEKFKPELEILV